MGIRIAKRIFVTCAHSVSEPMTETNAPGDQHFRRVRICVDGILTNLLFIGSAMPWNCDIALLGAQDDWLAMDLGSIAAVKTEALERYRVPYFLSFFLILECLFSAIVRRRLYFVPTQAPGLHCAWSWRCWNLRRPRHVRVTNLGYLMGHPRWRHRCRWWSGWLIVRVHGWNNASHHIHHRWRHQSGRVAGRAWPAN